MSGDDLPSFSVLAFGFCEAWSRRDAEGLLGQWDLNDPHATYLAAGTLRAMVGEAAIRAYVEGGCRAFVRIAMRPGPLHIRRLGPASGLAYFPMAWALQDKPGRQPYGGDVRVTMLMRETAQGPRIFHYAEAPLAPLVTLQKFYESIAADGLDAMPVAP